MSNADDLNASKREHEATGLPTDSPAGSVKFHSTQVEPDVVERFRILRQLGRGGMGTVFLAEDTLLHRQVALKFPLERFGSELSRFQREAETLAKLDHPNICPIYDVSLTHTKPFLALKYVTGETLETRLKQGPVEPRQAVEWCVTILGALTAAHQQNVIHRDLKPANVMIDSNGMLWLMDFGLSKILANVTLLSEDGSLCGTPGYMAPEQIDAKLGGIGPQTDIYSLGVVLYQMLTGRLPFCGSLQEVLGQTLYSEVESPSKVNPAIDPRMDAICAKAMAKTPNARFSSAHEFVAALLNIPNWKKVRRTRSMGIFAATLVTLGMCVFTLTFNHEKKPTVLTDNGQSKTGQFAPIDGRDEISSDRPTTDSDWLFSDTGQKADRTFNNDLSTQSIAILEKYCYSCHSNEKKQAGLDLRDRVTLLKPVDPNEKPYLVPGKPTESRIWNVLDQHNAEVMPPADQPQPTAGDKEILKRWIESGAEFPIAPRPERTFVGEQTLLSIIDRDLQTQPEANRPYLRYFSLVHLWNSNQSDEQLRLVRAAVSKLINSLSSQAKVVSPEIVSDSEDTVLRIDLRNYGWKGGKQWQAIAKAYPYGLEIAGDAYRRVTEGVLDFPYIRADWFVYTAARPPLYHELVTFPESIGLPETQSVLERILAVDAVTNYQTDQLKRAAFTGDAPGISDQNRMVERHRARYGYYWTSYHFLSESNHKNLFNFPLWSERFSQTNGGHSDHDVRHRRRGRPGHKSSRTNDDDFEHDGGELIFSLPNGFQGYMLVNTDGTRIDKGPQNIVRDANQHSGSYDVVNGVSCMGCHRHGLVRFTDSLRPYYVGRAGETAEKVLRLYPAVTEMRQQVDADRSRFMIALDAAISKFLRVDSHDKKGVDVFPEPINAASRSYGRPLKLADVTRELGLPASGEAARAAGLKCSSGELISVIKFSDRLRLELGLGPLCEQNSVPRPQWENVYGRVARELGVGKPITQL